LRSSPAVAAERRDHAGSQSGNRRGGKIRRFRAAGVNRLSLGIQSFNPAISRRWAAFTTTATKRAAQAIEIAARHFDNFNLDLMYGLPGQTLAEALERCRDRARLRAAAPLLLSADASKPNTAFAAQPPTAARGRHAAPTCRRRSRPGWPRRLYCITKPRPSPEPGKQCRHNLNYWHFGDYLGIGAGAHGKLTLHDRLSCARCAGISGRNADSRGQSALRVFDECTASGRWLSAGAL
jgi:coproporphyrinogen III oxidase-like Fe-S oxidoreductase